MPNPVGEARNDVLRVDFDRRVTVQFRGSVVTPMLVCLRIGNSMTPSD